MPKIKFEGLTQLTKEFNQLSKDLKNIDTVIIEELSGEAYTELNTEFEQFNDIDGNLSGETTLNISKNELTVSQEGDQVAFIEFGTGFKGAVDSHPLANENSWTYLGGGKGSKSKIRYSETNKSYGWYYNKKDGTYTFTTGIQAQKPAFNASETIEKISLEIADKIISEVIQ